VFEVRSAIHIRTGQRADVQAVDDWLAHHAVEVVGLGDVYEACVHLLKNYEQIPELALIGVDWLAAGDLNIVAYVRQTWSRTGIVVYGDGAEMPRLDLLPLSLACRGAVALRKLLTETPADLSRRLSADIAPVSIVAEPRTPRAPHIPAGANVFPAPRPAARESPELADDRAAGASPDKASEESGLRLADSAPPRAILTSEELSALLDSSDERPAG